MDKKKLAIIHYQMVNGGIETSLINFVNNFKDKFDITVYTIEKGVRDADLDCKVVNLLSDEEVKVFKTPFKQSLKMKLADFFKVFKMKLANKTGAFAKKLAQRVEHDVDVLVCYTAWNLPVAVAKYGFNARKKLCLVHADVEKAPLEKSVLKKLKIFDKVLCVSKTCREHLKNKYPFLAQKADFLFNMQNTNAILEKSKEVKIHYSNHFNMISVSRLSLEKGVARTIEALKKLSDEGYEFVYHIVGDGDIEHDLKQMVTRYGLDSKVVFHGSQLNPYPYIVEADLFLLLSMHEAAPMVYGEAMSLGVPVCSTNTCSAEELVGEKGFVCVNSDEGIYSKLKEILDNKQLVEQKKKMLKNYEYNNKQIEEKFYDLIGEGN